MSGNFSDCHSTIACKLRIKFRMNIFAVATLKVHKVLNDFLHKEMGNHLEVLGNCM